MASFDCLQKPNMDIEPSKRLSRKDLKALILSHIKDIQNLVYSIKKIKDPQ